MSRRCRTRSAVSAASPAGRSHHDGEHVRCGRRERCGAASASMDSSRTRSMPMPASAGAAVATAWSLPSNSSTRRRPGGAILITVMGCLSTAGVGGHGRLASVYDRRGGDGLGRSSRRTAPSAVSGRASTAMTRRGVSDGPSGLVAVRAQLAFAHGVLELDDGPDVLLAGHVAVGTPERGGAAHGRMVFERALDAHRVDVAAAAQDERVGRGRAARPRRRSARGRDRPSARAPRSISVSVPAPGEVADRGWMRSAPRARACPGRCSSSTPGSGRPTVQCRTSAGSERPTHGDRPAGLGRAVSDRDRAPERGFETWRQARRHWAAADADEQELVGPRRPRRPRGAQHAVARAAG